MIFRVQRLNTIQLIPNMRLLARLRPQISLRELIAALNPFGPSVRSFEAAFAKKFHNQYGVMFSHGRAGLFSLFKAWGLKNHEVICPAYTCVVVPHAIVLSGNTPVFVDSTRASFNMDYEELEKKINERTRAIVVTHLFGYPMDVERVNKIVKSAEEKFGRKIYVIQDVAHSFGAKWKGKLVTESGDASIFGLNISKMMTSIFGGMVTTNDLKTKNRLREEIDREYKTGFLKGLFRFIYLFAVYFAFIPLIYGFVNWLERKGFLDRFVKYYDESKIEFPSDWNTKPSSVEARVGLIQLKKYDKIISYRRKNALAYKQLFAGKSIEFFEDDPGATYSHCVGLVKERETWLEEFRRKGMQLGILIEYNVPEMSSYIPFAKGEEFPNSSYYSNHTINFPIWMGIRLKEKSLKDVAL